MEWLWLILGVAGLGLLWLLIIGMEKLTERLKEHDEARRLTRQDIAARTAAAEEEFLEDQYAKASAKDYIENGDFTGKDDPRLKEAIETLSSEELVQSVTRRMFGNPEGTDGITATRSAFDQTPVRKRAVAKGDGVSPVKVRPTVKSTLSKSEQKMLKKIKQGDWLFSLFCLSLILERGINYEKNQSIIQYLGFGFGFIGLRCCNRDPRDASANPVFANSQQFRW